MAVAALHLEVLGGDSSRQFVLNLLLLGAFELIFRRNVTCLIEELKNLLMCTIIAIIIVVVRIHLSLIVLDILFVFFNVFVIFKISILLQEEAFDRAFVVALQNLDCRLKNIRGLVGVAEFDERLSEIIDSCFPSGVARLRASGDHSQREVRA